jgi:hypothetical protein
VDQIIDNVLARDGGSNIIRVEQIALDDLDRRHPGNTIEAMWLPGNNADRVALL